MAFANSPEPAPPPASTPPPAPLPATAPAPAPAGRYVAETVRRSAKILVVGCFGVGKTTLIGSVSEIAPLRTEEPMTAASVGVDDLAGLDGKRETTVAMDFGRVTVTSELVLYLFGTPGQRRFWDLWEGLAEGAVGALVLVDTRRLEQSFEVLDQLEIHTAGLPFAVAANNFPDSPRYGAAELSEALDLPPRTPVIGCDARDRPESVKALIALVEHALSEHALSAHALPAQKVATL